MATSCPDQSLVQRVRYWSYLQEQLGLFVCHDPDSQAVKNGSYCFAALALLIALLDCWFIKKALEKEKKIVTPQGMPFNETYCVMSLKLLRVAKYGLFAQVILMVYQATLFLSPPEVYNKLMYGDMPAVVRECNEQEEFFGVWVIHCSISSIASIFLDFIIIYQSIEWKVMLDLILFQKDRTPDEIMDDHNLNTQSSNDVSSLMLTLKESTSRSSHGSTQGDEDDEDSVSESFKSIKQKTFRTLESRAKICHNFSAVLVFLFLLVIYPLGFATKYNLVQVIILAERTLLQLWCSWVFFRLYYSMQKMHKFEFSRNKRLLENQFIIISFCQLSRIIYLINFLRFPEVIKEEACNCLCQDAYNLYIIDGATSSFNVVVMICIYIYFFPIPLLVASLLFLKSSQDILQGISKLDYLLKVSVFQVYKDKELQTAGGRDMTVGPASTFQRVSSSINDPSEQYIAGSSSVLETIKEEE